MVWEFGPNKISTWNRKKQLFSQKLIFKGKFELWGMLRKYGLRGFRNSEKMVVQVLPKLVTRPSKHKFLNFRSSFGPNIF